MKKGTVLLADRHQNMLEGIRGLLETMFDSVIMVADETSLLQAVDRLSPDLAVVDLSLQAIKEVNVAKQLKDRYPELRVIVLSVHDDPTVADKIMESGIEGFVLKRAVATDLLPAIDAVLVGGTYLSPSLQKLNIKERS